MKRQNSYMPTNQTKQPSHMAADLATQRPIVQIEYTGETVDVKGRASERRGWGLAKTMKAGPILPVEVETGGLHVEKASAAEKVLVKAGKFIPTKMSVSYVVCRAMADAESFPAKLERDKLAEMTVGCVIRGVSSRKLASAKIDVVALAEKDVDDIVDALFEDVDEDVISRRMEAMFCGDSDEVKK